MLSNFHRAKFAFLVSVRIYPKKGIQCKVGSEPKHFGTIAASSPSLCLRRDVLNAGIHKWLTYVETYGGI